MKKNILIQVLFMCIYSCNALADSNNLIENIWIKVINKNHESKNISCNNQYCDVEGKKIKLSPNVINYKVKTISEKYIIKNLEGFSSMYRGKGYLWNINNSISVNNFKKVNNKIVFSHYISVKGNNYKNIINLINYFKTNRYTINYDNFKINNKKWKLKMNINSKLKNSG